MVGRKIIRNHIETNMERKRLGGHGEKRIETMKEFMAAIKKCRDEDSGIPISTMGIILCDHLGDTHEVRSLITSMEEYLV